MTRFGLTGALALLLATGASGHSLRAVKSHVGIDNGQCKITCQRFGMKALGPAFEDITDPTKCVDKCDEVYPAGGAKSATSALQTATPSSKAGTDQSSCKVKCQRFGMKSMGDEFKGIKSPVKCVKKCEEVFSA